MSVNVRRNLAIQLIPIGGANPLKMRISNPTAFVINVAGTTAALIGQGGTPAYAYSITSGALPTGLSLNSTTGIISGTPSATGTFVFTAQVQDAALTAYIATFSIAVANPLSFNPNLPAADAGVAYSYKVPIVGATGTVTFTAAGPSRGLSISTTGLITGSPVVGIPATLTTTATDSGTGASISMTLGVQIFTTSFLFIPSTTLAATVGATSSLTYTLTSNVGPYTITTSTPNVALVVLNAGNIFSSGGSFRLSFTPDAATYPLLTQSGTIPVHVTDGYGLTTTLNLPYSVANPNAPNQYASGSQAGQISTTAQTIPGPKTYLNNVTAPAYGTPGNNLGTVTTSVAFNFQIDALNIFTFTSGTNVTSATALTNPPVNPGFIAVKCIQGAVASSMTWPTSFKGAWPTTGFLATKTSFFVGYFDGTNFNYIGGTQNAY